MSDSLSERLAREAWIDVFPPPSGTAYLLDREYVVGPIRMADVLRIAQITARAALDEAAKVAGRYTFTSAHMNTQWHHGQAGVEAATECAAKIAAAIEALKKR